jgi:hypothetical protein
MKKLKVHSSKKFIDVKVIFLTILAIFILFLPAVQAISFGSLQIVKNINILPNQAKEIKILVWNSGEDEFYLSFDVVKSLKDIEVEILPNNFLLTKEPTGDVEAVSVGNDVFKAKVVKVIFKAGKDPESGEIAIKAVAKSNAQWQISVSQARDFKFLINTNKISKNETISKENLQIASNQTEKLSQEVPKKNATRKEEEKGNNKTANKEKNPGTTGFFALVPGSLNFSLLFIIPIAGALLIYLYLKERKREVIKRIKR